MMHSERMKLISLLYYAVELTDFLIQVFILLIFVLTRNYFLEITS